MPIMGGPIRAIRDIPYLGALHIARSILLNYSPAIPQDKYLRILFLDIWQRLKEIEHKHSG